MKILKRQQNSNRNNNRRRRSVTQNSKENKKEIKLPIIANFPALCRKEKRILLSMTESAESAANILRRANISKKYGFRFFKHLSKKQYIFIESVDQNFFYGLTKSGLEVYKILQSSKYDTIRIITPSP